MTLPNTSSPETATLSEHVWALILAGGEGNRLRKLTTKPCGTAVPKQFCSLAGGRALLEDAIARARGIAPADHICTIVAQQHREWWSDMLDDHSAKNVIVQPRNRGTGIGILYSVLHIAARDPAARILILPADHCVLDEQVLRKSLVEALNQLQHGADVPILLGLEPDHSDCELGYILPGGRDGSGTQAVARFIEKPDLALAGEIISEGALWNTFIMAASVRALVDMFMGRYATLALEMQMLVSRALSAGAGGAGWPALVNLYERLPSLDFSRDLLEGQESALRLLRVPACGWSDLGTPIRVAETLRRLPPEHSSRHGRTAPFVNLATQHALFELSAATG